MEDMENIEYLAFENKIEGTEIGDLSRVLQESKLELIIEYFNEVEFQDEKKLKLFFNHILGTDISKYDLYQLINSKNGKKIKTEEYEEESENHKKNLDIVKLIMCKKCYYKVFYDYEYSDWEHPNKEIKETTKSDDYGNMSIAEDYLKDWWQKFIYDELPEQPLEEGILRYPFLLNTPTPVNGERKLVNEAYNGVLRTLFSREDFPWNHFNELADKVALYSLADFFHCVPKDKKEYIAEYICSKCDNARYSFLIDKYYVYGIIGEENVELMIRILTKDGNDGSWLKRDEANHYIKKYWRNSLIVDQVIKWGNTEQKNLLVALSANLPDEEREKLEDRIEEEEHKLEDQDTERIKEEQDLKKRFEKYIQAKKYDFSKDTKPTFSIRVELDWNDLSIKKDKVWGSKAKFKYMILYELYNNNINGDTSKTISSFLRNISGLINALDDKERIAGNLKEAVKEVLNELDTIGLRFRKDGSIASKDSHDSIKNGKKNDIYPEGH